MRSRKRSDGAAVWLLTRFTVAAIAAASAGCENGFGGTDGSASALSATPPTGALPGAPPSGGTCSGGCGNNSTCTFDTYIGATNYLEIDQDMSSSGNANLTNQAGATNNFPAPLTMGTTPTYFDWNDGLLSDSTHIDEHLLRDLDSGNKDPTAFPMGPSSDCLGSAGVEGKFDLTYIAAASNNDYVYLAVARSDNNGDGAYYWIFTAIQPSLTTACGQDGHILRYRISPGDVLVRGHFAPSSDPATDPILTVCRSAVTMPTGSLLPVEAIDFDNAALWNCTNQNVAARAVNLENTPGGTYGVCGVDVDVAGQLPPQTFAEAAVALNTFGGGSVCGQTFWATVITRPSGSGGTSPDLKDSTRPAAFNFGPGLSVSIAATPGPCTDSLTYTATTSGGSGSGQTFTWTNNCTPVAMHPEQCTVNPADDLFCTSTDVQVSVRDSLGCTATSEKEQYRKVTHVCTIELLADGGLPPGAPADGGCP